MRSYDKKRHDKSEIEVRGRIGDIVYERLYGEDVKRKYLPRGDKRDLEKGIDLFIDDIPVGERLREARTADGMDLCVLEDITIRTRSKDDKKLEMFTSEAKEFVYAVENYEKNGICRSYRIDMAKLQKHYFKKDFSCREIQNKDGNYFVPILIHELDKYGIIINRYPKKSTNSTLDGWFS